MIFNYTQVSDKNRVSCLLSLIYGCTRVLVNTVQWQIAHGVQYTCTVNCLAGTGNTLESKFQGVARYNSKIPARQDSYLLFYTRKLAISVRTVKVYPGFFLLPPRKTA